MSYHTTESDGQENILQVNNNYETYRMLKTRNSTHGFHCKDNLKVACIFLSNLYKVGILTFTLSNIDNF